MPGRRILLWSVLVLVGLLFLYLVRGVLLPFVLSFIVAALLEPTVRRVRSRGLSRQAAVWAVVAPFYLGLVLLIVLVAPQVTREASLLTARAQEIAANLSRVDPNENFFLRWNPANPTPEGGAQERIDALLARYAPTLERLGLPSTRRAILDQYVAPRRPEIAKYVRDAFGSAFGFLTGLFSQLVVVAMLFLLVPLFLLEMEEFRNRGPRWIPPSIRDSTVAMFGDIGQVFVRYLRGIVWVVLLYTLAQTFLLWITGVPYWILLGPIFGVLYLVPYIGNIISALTVFGVVGFANVTGWLVHPVANPWAYALIVTLLYLLVGFTFDHLIYPQMVGNSVGLSPVVSIFVIFCGAALFGLPGMLIAFPLAGSVKVILDRAIRYTSTTSEGLRLPSVPARHRPA